MGNKLIGCHECTLDIHGKVKSHTWSLMSATANEGDSTISLQDAVDWEVGDEIIIASSDWNHLHAERRTITAISGTTITLNEDLKYTHYSASETYTYTDSSGASANESIDMYTEVGLLSRNVVI